MLHTRAAERAALAASEPSTLSGTRHIFIDAPWVGTPASIPGADTSSANASVGKGPQENSVRDSETRTGGGGDGGGGTELLASQDEPHEEEAGEQAPAEEEEEPATGERAAEGEHEEDEEVSATEAGGAEGSNESEGADGAEEFPVSQASQVDGDDDPAKVEDDAAPATEEEDWEDNERSERRFGYDPDRAVDPWEEYQAVMEDPMLAY
jgi:hypothetical protein